MWRGENTQRGRYREFMQCDFDTIGTHGIAADVETILVTHDLLRAIGFERFTIRVNNRLVLGGLLEVTGSWRLGHPRAASHRQALQDRAGARDRRDCALGRRDASTAGRIVEMVRLEGTNDEILRQLAGSLADSPRGRDGVERMTVLLAAVTAAGVLERARSLRRVDRSRPRLLYRHRVRNNAR